MDRQDPFSAEVEVYGCRWRADTIRNTEAGRWDVRVELEGNIVASCHLDEAAWATRTCRLVDPAAALADDVRFALEVRLEQVVATTHGELAPRWPTRSDITRRIDIAFAGVAMPTSAIELSTDSLEGPSVVEHFLGKERGEAEASFLLSLHREDFDYMTATALAYYLPVVLRLMLRPPYDDELWFFLRRFLASERHDGLRALSSTQLQAISDWARYLHVEWTITRPPLIDPAEAQRLADAFRSP